MAGAALDRAAARRVCRGGLRARGDGRLCGGAARPHRAPDDAMSAVRTRTIALTWALLAAGCAWERPKANPPPISNGEPLVVGARGVLSPQRSEDAVEDAVAQARYRERAERLVDAVQAATRTPLIAGNRTKLLIDGPATYAAMFAAVREARHQVDVETYIFDDGDTARRFAALLGEKQREGVEIRIIYDAIGASEAADLFTALDAQGVRTVAYRPI